MRDRYTLIVGLLFVAVILVAVVDRVGSGGDGTLGLDERPANWPLPEFAVPDASAPLLEGDANVAQDDCSSGAVPCPEAARRTPACRLDDEEAIRVCDLFGRPSLISFWFSGRDGGCIAQQDVVQRAADRFQGRVNFLSLNVRDDRDQLREWIAERGWTMPVGYDRDGAVASLYRVGGCPTLAYVYPGGTLHSASVGELTETQLGSRIERLLDATAEAEAARS